MKDAGAEMLSGTRISSSIVPVAGPGLAEKPNTGGFVDVGVFVPLSVQMLPRLQNPCSVGLANAGVTLPRPIAAVARAIINTRRITVSLPLPLKGSASTWRVSVGDGPCYVRSLACVNDC